MCLSERERERTFVLINLHASYNSMGSSGNFVHIYIILILKLLVCAHILS